MSDGWEHQTIHRCKVGWRLVAVYFTTLFDLLSWNLFPARPMQKIVFVFYHTFDGFTLFHHVSDGFTWSSIRLCEFIRWHNWRPQRHHWCCIVSIHAGRRSKASSVQGRRFFGKMRWIGFATLVELIQTSSMTCPVRIYANSGIFSISMPVADAKIHLLGRCERPIKRWMSGYGLACHNVLVLLITHPNLLWSPFSVHCGAFNVSIWVRNVSEGTLRQGFSHCGKCTLSRNQKIGCRRKQLIQHAHMTRWRSLLNRTFYCWFLLYNIWFLQVRTMLHSSHWICKMALFCATCSTRCTRIPWHVSSPARLCVRYCIYRGWALFKGHYVIDSHWKHSLLALAFTICSMRMETSE